MYSKTAFYIYSSDSNELVGIGCGKEILSILNCDSWKTIVDCLRYKNGWYKNFYISETKLTKLPVKKNSKSISVDIYDSNGIFIETLPTIKMVKEKYKIRSENIKNIQLIDKYIGNYIFKKSSK
nr:MAG TPA: hypothetical protein [Bacteriophage sp.]